MKLKYIGESFGVDGLTSEKIYECLGVEADVFYRVIDDSEEDYLYPIKNPRPVDRSSRGGRWEIVEDDENETLKKAMERFDMAADTPEGKEALSFFGPSNDVDY